MKGEFWGEREKMKDEFWMHMVSFYILDTWRERLKGEFLADHVSSILERDHNVSFGHIM